MGFLPAGFDGLDMDRLSPVAGLPPLNSGLRWYCWGVLRLSLDIFNKLWLYGYPFSRAITETSASLSILHCRSRVVLFDPDLELRGHHSQILLQYDNFTNFVNRFTFCLYPLSVELLKPTPRGFRQDSHLGSRISDCISGLLSYSEKMGLLSPYSRKSSMSICT